MLQAFGAGIGMAIAAYFFDKLDRRGQIIAGSLCAVWCVAMVVWAVWFIGQ